MKKQIFKLIVLFVFAPVFLVAQPLINVADLVKIQKNPDLVIISAGTDAEYAKAHITNAVHVAYTSFDQAGDIKGLLVADAEIAKILSEKGVSEKNTIVVYDEFDGRYAGRIYLLLKYMGAKNVSVLDGGLEAWKKDRKPITRNPTVVKKTTFNASPNKAWMATMAEAEAAAGKANVMLIDTRSAEEFNGTKDSKGHIKGAINIEYKQLLNADGTMKPAAELEKLYSAKGVTKDKEVILYCSTGVRTGLHFIALIEILGYTKVKVYDGGYNEFVAKNPSGIVK